LDLSVTVKELVTWFVINHECESIIWKPRQNLLGIWLACNVGLMSH
jgi:hypothetical protein